MVSKQGHIAALALLLGWGSAATNASGAEASEYSHVAIQRSKFSMAHEIKLSAGFMPLDPFQKGYTASLSYTEHLSGQWAWEMIQLTVAHLTSTSLRDELIGVFAVPQEEFAAPLFMATTGLELTPLYGKLALFNDAQVHHSFLVGAHAGVIFGDRGSIVESLKDFRPAVGIGIGYRIFVNELISTRFDARYFVSFNRAVRSTESFEIDNVVLINVSGSVNLWRDDT